MENNTNEKICYFLKVVLDPDHIHPEEEEHHQLIHRSIAQAIREVEAVHSRTISILRSRTITLTLTYG